MKGVKMTIAKAIIELAQKHNIEPVVTEIDRLARQFNRLSDAEVEIDDIQQLMVNLERAGYLTSKEATNLHLQYILERN